MKKGLTYISERTGQLRYADHLESEKWLQPLSEYKPIENIKRGEAVSIATIYDLERIADKKQNKTLSKEDILNFLVNSTDSYIVKTNPAIHTSTVGLALEHASIDALFENEDSLKTFPKIHVISHGKYIEDKDYVKESDQLNGALNVDEFEYWPNFFNDYKKHIGKKVYVDGRNPGQLTIEKEHAYLADCNVIIVGILVDADIQGNTSNIHVGAIEVQIEGDDRGAIDATQIEATIGEDFVIGDPLSVGGTTIVSKTKVFALGCEEDAKFKFSFNAYIYPDTIIPKGFIALQRLDGNTSFIFTNGHFDLEDFSLNHLSIEDKAFIQVARSYKASTTSTFTMLDLNGDSYDGDFKATAANLKKVEDKLNEAMSSVAYEKHNSLVNPSQEIHITGLDITKNEYAAGISFTATANDIGGYYDIYISNSLKGIFKDCYVSNHGSEYNKGYAVLADIRNKKRQNILGIYNSGHTGKILRGTRAIFLKQGLFIDSSNSYVKGATYYLGSNGNIFQVPQEFYNSIVKVGYAQDTNRLIVDLSDSRMYNNGDLPVGYVKPSVKGEAEFGFWLMDGMTPHKVEDAPLLFERLKGQYEESELKVKNYDFGASGTSDIAKGFIIPAVKFQKHVENSSDNGYVAAQIKWLAEGVYKELQRLPFVRRTFTLIEDSNNVVTIPDIDITSLVIYGPEEDRVYVPELEMLNIKMFIDTQNEGVASNPSWTQIDPGFEEYNNTTYFGFKWNVIQTKAPSIEHPFGEWVLRASYNEGAPDANVLGVYVKSTPFSPPQSMANHIGKIVISRSEYYTRQFDVENLFKDYVKESIVDMTGTPWSGNSVSGKAVVEYIRNEVTTQKINLGKETDPATIVGYIDKVNVVGKALTNEDELANRKITSDIKFSSPASLNYDLHYYNGRLKYFFKGNAADNTSTTLRNFVKEDGLNFTPWQLFTEHEALDITKNDSPHGILNKGYSGNLNAKYLQGANLGTPKGILASNIDNTTNDIFTPVNANFIIPFLRKNPSTQHFYITLGNEVRHQKDFGFGGVKDFVKNSYDIIDVASLLNDKKQAYNLEEYVSDHFGSVRKSIKGQFDESSLKEISMLFDLKGDSSADITFQKKVGTGDYEPATIVAITNAPSSIKYKKIFAEYFGKNTKTNNQFDLSSTPDGFFDDLEENKKQYGEALQAIYEMPLAVFKYRNESDVLKKYFGIITERVAATKETFDNDSDVKNNTTFENLINWTYNDEERKSISNYLEAITDNKNAAQNIISSVGILLKAAKETQERLLNLEISTYGNDSPTLPGSDNLNANVSNLSQNSTIAGLNRLVRALCREVFQKENPSHITDLGAWINDSNDKYSRVDVLDKAVHGINAIKENPDPNLIHILDESVNTYPVDYSTVETQTINHTTVIDSVNNNDFNNGQEFISEVIYDNSYTPQNTDNFDGLNDAVNKIVKKLNYLTGEIHGEDKILNRPKRLDFIRQTLETLLRDVFYDDDSNSTLSTSLEDGPYKKSNLSRIDKLLQVLYNFDLNGIGDDNTSKTFNGNSFVGEMPTDVGGTIITAYNSVSPTKLNQIYKQASIIDVIIELLTGDEKTLIKQKNPGHTPASPGTDEGNENFHAADYEPIKDSEQYQNKYLSETILSRLRALELSVEALSFRTLNKINFDELTAKLNGVKVSPYINISSLDVFMDNIAALLGIKVTNKINLIGTKTAEQAITDLNDILHGLKDTVTRLRKAEQQLLTYKSMLGAEYDSYEYNINLSINSPESLWKKEYNLTSDISSLLKLLYGKGEENTPHTHFNANSVNNLFAEDNDGINVLKSLYTQLYNVPMMHKNDQLSVNITKLESVENFENIIYDYTQPKKGESPKNILQGKNRQKYIAQGIIENKIPPFNRIDVLEKGVAALYNYVGLGDKTQSINFFDGQIQYTKEGIINEQKYGTTPEDWNEFFTYSDLIHSNTSLKLSHFAVQAYLNTLFIRSTGIGNLSVDSGKVNLLGNTTSTSNEYENSPYSNNSWESVTKAIEYLYKEIKKIPNVGSDGVGNTINGEGFKVNTEKGDKVDYKISVNHSNINSKKYLANLINRDQEVIDLQAFADANAETLLALEENTQQYTMICNELGAQKVSVVKKEKNYYVKAESTDDTAYYLITTENPPDNSIFTIKTPSQENVSRIKLTLKDDRYSHIELTAYVSFKENNNENITNNISNDEYFPKKYILMKRALEMINSLNMTSAIDVSTNQFGKIEADSAVGVKTQQTFVKITTTI